MQTWQKYFAEAIGTFSFIFIATASVLANWQTGGALGTIGVAFTTGLMLAAMIYAMYHISGGHFNPAITIALWATGNVKTLMALGYVIAQLTGSILSAFALKFVFANISPQFYLGDVMLGSGVTPAMGIFIEALLTFFLVWTVFGTLVDKRATPGFGGLAAGIVLAVSIMVAAALTGGALNPARSFGPALLTSHWANHYVYWIGPIVGGLVAAFIYKFSLLKKN